MNRDHLLELFVIDAMADDYEDLEQIGKSVELDASACGIPFSSSQVAATLRTLIATGFVKAYRFELNRDDAVKQNPFHGIVRGLDDQTRFAKIQLDNVPIEKQPYTLEIPVRELAEYAKLKIGERVRGVIFTQYPYCWFGEIHEDDGKRSPVYVRFTGAVEVPGIPSDRDFDTLWYGLSPKGRAIQDSDAPPDWPFDDYGVLKPGWTLDED